MQKVVGLGAGGHSKMVIETLRLAGKHQIIGLLDPKQELWQTHVLETPVLGGDELLPKLHDQGVRLAFIGLGSVGETDQRRRLYNHAISQGFQIVPAIHPKAVVSDAAVVGDAPTILALAVINPDAQIEDNVIVNTGAIIEHDCIVNSHVHVATGAVLAASVKVGTGAHIGAGATIRQGINIGEGALIGIGAAVVKDVEPWTVVAGVPAHVLSHRAPHNKLLGEIRPSEFS